MILITHLLNFHQKLTLTFFNSTQLGVCEATFDLELRASPLDFLQNINLDLWTGNIKTVADAIISKEQYFYFRYGIIK
jgi:hypothetical protein